MLIALVVICVFLFICILILFAKANNERTKTKKDLARYQNIIDVEHEVRLLKKALDEEESSRRKSLLDEEKRSRKSLDLEIKKKRDEFEKDFKLKSKAIAERDNASLKALEESQKSIDTLNAEYAKKRKILIDLTEHLAEVEDSIEMVSYGVYKPKFDYHDSTAYQEAILKNKERQKVLLRQNAACDSNTNWEVNGSKAEGKKMITRYVKLLLRAFNSECDASIAKIKVGNIDQLHARIEKAFDAINKFGQSMNIRITFDYLNLRLDELLLCHEKEIKIQNEKDILREERELQREEEKAQKEYERAIKEEQKAERDFLKAMRIARAELEKANEEERLRIESKILDLEDQLEAAKKLSERAKSQAQITRSGHVYVISNIGSFGEDVIKIGLTRRLEPEDRINELSSASVPFKFDIHALIYANDAPALELSLHRAFEKHRINLVNNRKEFFKVGLDIVEDKVKELGFDAKFVEFARASDYRETLAMIDKRTKQELLHESTSSIIDERFPELI